MVEKIQVDCKPTKLPNKEPRDDPALCEKVVEDGLDMIAKIVEMLEGGKIEPMQLLSYITEAYEDYVAAQSCDNYQPIYDAVIAELVKLENIIDASDCERDADLAYTNFQDIMNDLKNHNDKALFMDVLYGIEEYQNIKRDCVKKAVVQVEEDICEVAV